jgi:hypothetical protein
MLQQKLLTVLPFITLLICFGLCACSEEKVVLREESSNVRIQQMIESEEMVLKLTPKLRALGASIVSGSRDDLPEAVAGDASIPPWNNLEPTHRWINASFGTLSAHFKDDTFVMKTKFEGVSRGKDGEIVGIKAKQKLTWKQENADRWRLAKWEPLSFETDSSTMPLFEEVLDTVLPHPIALGKARHSYHEEVLSKTFAGQTAFIGKYSLKKTSDIESTYSYPTVSVVDFDSDGLEDIFISSRWLSAQLLRNCGDGTFKDVTKETGLTVENFVNFALFADFDNDGDPDAILGRTLRSTLYYRNDGGVFTDVTQTQSDLGRQLFVSSASVTDVNRDGLLDVYLSTYSASLYSLSTETQKKSLPPRRSPSSSTSSPRRTHNSNAKPGPPPSPHPTPSSTRGGLRMCC